MDARDTPWTSEQCEWLLALGHDVLMLAPAPGEAMADPEPVPDRVNPGKARIGATTKPSSSTPPLLHALARAAGCREDDVEFLRTVPDLATLRGNPEARRALWPRLRALRKRAAR
jgi:hypothetical protein